MLWGYPSGWLSWVAMAASMVLLWTVVILVIHALLRHPGTHDDRAVVTRRAGGSRAERRG